MSYGAPEITPQEVQRLRTDSPGEWILLDVREVYELGLAAIPGEDVLLAPLSELSEQGVNALPEEARDKSQPIVVFCHHGIRSGQVTAWLRHEGWTQVLNMRGGIDAYALEVDPTVGAYH